jgi:hypothetical protein
MHSRPNFAQAVAVATPCWPAPVSLAHADREQGLAERVVDLVGAGVGEVFPLEPDLAAAGQIREPRGEVQRAGAAHERLEQAVELGLKGRVGDGRGILPLELVERRRERLGHVAAAESAEPAQRVGHGGERGGGDRRRHGQSRGKAAGACTGRVPDCSLVGSAHHS